MRIASIAITNMAGFAAAEDGKPGLFVTLPAIALIQGKNEYGKTSFLDCIRYTFGRGHDPDIIHGGAEWGENIVAFDDGSAVKCRASRKTNETTRAYRAPGSNRFTVGREQIDAMTNAISYHALAFKDLDEKEQMLQLSTIVRFTADPERIAAAVGAAQAELADVELPQTGNVLDVIAALDKTMRARRPDLSSAAESQEHHAEELAKTLPADGPGQDWEVEAKRLRKEQTDLNSGEQASISALKQQFLVDKATAETRVSTKYAAIDKDIQAEIDILEAQRTRRKEEIVAREKSDLETLRTDAAKKRDDILAANAPMRQQITHDLGVAETNAKGQQQAIGTRAAIAKALAGAKQSRERWQTLTDALERLNGLRLELLKRFPIPGVLIQDGRIWARPPGDYPGLNGEGPMVPFRRWNEEKQIRFCLKLAVMAHGKAGVICIDRAESLDSEHRRGLIAAAKKYAESEGLQFFICTVSDYPGLKIEAAE